MLALVTAAILLSAFLLFLVQPMIAKMILPRLGGAPAVWNTCMVFFQIVLLMGYLYVHRMTDKLPLRRQVMLHLVVIALPLLVLPIGLAFSWTPDRSRAPILWLLALLTASIGPAFFALSTTAPLLQKWFSKLHHQTAKDPYVLYAASNLGSMLALLGYPILIESHFPLYQEGGWISQRWLWSLGYGMLIVLIGMVGWGMWCSSMTNSNPVHQETGREAGVSTPLGAITMVRWIVWAFVPSSLMLGATSYVTLNIAAIPLLWIIPLVIYLLSFILVFARWPERCHRVMIKSASVTLILLVFSMASEKLSIPFSARILLHLTTLFVIATVCHGELALSRPPTNHLTKFFLAVSVGGALGGVLNALVAPVLFNDVIEYMLVLIVAGLVLPRSAWVESREPSKSLALFGGLVQPLRDAAWVIAVGGVTGVLVWLFTENVVSPGIKVSVRADMLGFFDRFIPSLGIESTQWTELLTYGLPLVLCYAMMARPIRFGLGLGVVLLAAHMSLALNEEVVVLHQERTFFGVLKVKLDRAHNTHRLIHGNTNHGGQHLDPSQREEPMAYFHRKGPIGQLFESFQGERARHHIAVTGLGAGTLASYAQPGQSMTFFEIDASIIDVALDPQYFTYCEDAKQRGVNLRVVLGDGRLSMEQAPNERYDLVVLDAFSSDSLPVHLITREAFAMYLRKMTADGLIAVNISNRYLDLAPILGNLAEDLHLVGLAQHDHEDEDVVPGKYPSHWVVLAKQRDALGMLVEDVRWKPIEKNPNVGVWTDDFSNVLSVFDWKS